MPAVVVVVGVLGQEAAGHLGPILVLSPQKSSNYYAWLDGVLS